MCKTSIFKIFFLVYKTLHCQSTDRIRIRIRIRIRWKFSGSGSATLLFFTGVFICLLVFGSRSDVSVNFGFHSGSQVPSTGAQFFTERSIFFKLRQFLFIQRFRQSPTVYFQRKNRIYVCGKKMKYEIYLDTQKVIFKNKF